MLTKPVTVPLVLCCAWVLYSKNITRHYICFDFHLFFSSLCTCVVNTQKMRKINRTRKNKKKKVNQARVNVKLHTANCRRDGIYRSILYDVCHLCVFFCCCTDAGLVFCFLFFLKCRYRIINNKIYSEFLFFFYKIKVEFLSDYML